MISFVESGLGVVNFLYVFIGVFQENRFAAAATESAQTMPLAIHFFCGSPGPSVYQFSAPVRRAPSRAVEQRQKQFGRIFSLLRTATGSEACASMVGAVGSTFWLLYGWKRRSTPERRSAQSCRQLSLDIGPAAHHTPTMRTEGSPSKPVRALPAPFDTFNLSDILSGANRRPGPARKLRIVLIDEQSVFRRGMVDLIQKEKDLKVCAQFSAWPNAMDAIPAAKPDLMILELPPRDAAGVALIKQIKPRYPALRLLVLSTNAESFYAERVLRAGANGFAFKHDNDTVLLGAIRLVLGGETYVSPKLAEQLALRFIGGAAPATDSLVSALSDRELQVFRLIGTGHSTREIAESLHLSIKTIETYREHLKQKLGVDSGVVLARRAVQWTERCAASNP